MTLEGCECGNKRCEGVINLPNGKKRCTECGAESKPLDPLPGPKRHLFE